MEALVVDRVFIRYELGVARNAFGVVEISVGFAGKVVVSRLDQLEMVGPPVPDPRVDAL